MKTYRCTSDWSKYKKGDVIEHWLWRKFPAAQQQKHFSEIVETKRVERKEVPVVVAKPAAPDVATVPK